MQYRHSSLLATAIFLFGAIPATAQLQSIPANQQSAPPQPHPERTVSVTHMASPKVRFAYRANAPFSAEQHTDQIMAASNGSSRERHVVTLIYQDSAGRRRTDRHLFEDSGSDDFRGSIVVYQIDDPIAGYRYIVDPQNRVAHRSVLEGQSAPLDRDLGVPGPGIQRPGVEAHPKMESLGTRDILGVMASGHRVTLTYGPDPMDPIPDFTYIAESWSSRDLWLPLLTTTSRGGGGGTSTISIVKLTLDEPDASLFKIPEGYSVADEIAPFEMKFTVPAKPSSDSH